MNKDLAALNEEIEMLMKKSPSMDKYQRLGVLFVCKQHIENALTTDKTTVSEIIEEKKEQTGSDTVLFKLTPILSEHISDMEKISPTISGEFIKKLKERL